MFNILRNIIQKDKYLSSDEIIVTYDYDHNYTRIKDIKFTEEDIFFFINELDIVNIPESLARFLYELNDKSSFIVYETSIEGNEIVRYNNYTSIMLEKVNKQEVNKIFPNRIIYIYNNNIYDYGIDYFVYLGLISLFQYFYKKEN